MIRRNRLGILSLVASCIAGSPLVAQQLPDSSFNPPIARPAWGESAGPRLCVDQAHHNFHTLARGFLAFGRLAKRDGFRVAPSGEQLAPGSLSRCDVLVIANAQWTDAAWSTYPSPTPSAFTGQEIASVTRWVEGGGSLLLVADHMPLAGAAAQLGRVLGFEFRDGFALRSFTSPEDRTAALAEPLHFRRDNALLRDHAVTRGRDSTEVVSQVRSFTGQAFRDLRGDATPVLVLPANFVSLEPRIAWQFTDSSPVRPAGGWLQGALRRVGRGRIAVFGEAAMFTAQVAGPQRAPMGMNAPGAEENARFTLNVLRWLGGALDQR